MDVSLAVGSSFLSAFLQVVFDRMASREFLSLFGEQKHDIQLLNRLQTSLMCIYAVLDDAECKQSMGGAVEKWLNELTNVVYQSDDLLDEINTEALRAKVEGECANAPSQVYNSISSFSNEFLREITPKMLDVIDRLQHFARQIELLGLGKGVSRMHDPCRLPSSSLFDESSIIGRDGDKEKIIEILLSDGENDGGINVIPLVGLGGVGKTTVAQLVYNDERVKSHFDVEAWACISEEYDAVRVTKTLLQEFTSLNFDGSESFNYLQTKLRDNLSGKRFLLVLDDIWSINYIEWDTLRNPFRQGRKGSKIIVTTRDERIAQIVCSRPHYMKPISDEDGWYLFIKHAFENGSLGVHPELEAVGKDIVRKCKGLPLAVKTMAGLVRSKSNVEEWEDILKSSGWELPNDQSGILQTLKLSYNHLPSPLKRCFALCALFPKGYPISKKEVVQLWLANDLLQHPRKSMEEIGNEYIQELTLRSFFQQTIDNYFTMHDLINDLAQFVAGEFSVRLESQQSHINTAKLRHLSYSREAIDTIEKFELLADAKFLRSFLPISVLQWPVSSYIPTELLLEILPSFSSLRVLPLAHYGIVELPYSIGTLRQLRLLDLSFTKIERLPDSLSRLYNLLVLLLAGCHSLVALPANLGKLSKLRYLEISGTQLRRMPRQMSRLKDLRVLTYFIVGKERGSRIEELGELCHLGGTLSILMLQNVATGMEASKAKMIDKKRLEVLVLEWSSNIDDSQNDVDVLKNLQPHRNIRDLTIKGYSSKRFPNWVGEKSFCNMVTLRLGDCKNCISLPALGQLASLKVLIISRMDRISMVGPEFYGNAIRPFESLIELGFENMLEWEEWCVLGNGEFPNLQKLLMVDCPKFIGKLPNQLFSLRTLHISGCPMLKLADGLMTLSNRHNILPQHLSSLHKLMISGMSNLRELPAELCTLSSLAELEIRGCLNLASFPNTGLPVTLRKLSIGQCDSLLSLPDGMTHVTELIVSDCQSLQFFPISGQATALQEVNISSCQSLKFPAPDITENCYVAFQRLERLKLKWSCHSLHDISLGIFPSLQSLCIYGCENLQELTIPNEVQDLASLSALEICECNNLVSFPRQGLPAPNLGKLTVWFCRKLQSLPRRMQSLLPSLRCLEVGSCPEIDSFPEGGLPVNLESLCINNCEKLTSCQRERNLQRLPSLRVFEIGETCQELFPDEGLLPRTLQRLTINDDRNLRRLNHKGLQRLVSLETLNIWRCPQLHSLSEGGLNRICSLRSLYIRNCPQIQSVPHELLPPYLSTLQIEECPSLRSHLLRERPKIANSRVLCDGEVIPQVFQ